MDDQPVGFRWMPGIATMLAVSLACLSIDVHADDFTPNPGETARFVEYERQLNAILKTRRDEEKQFIARVVDQVEAGKLPAKLVNTSFDWVRKKRPLTNYPFIYFERVLRLQAEGLGIEEEVPPFDFAIYQSAGRQTDGQRGTAGQQTAFRRLLRFTPGTRR